jgi:hypothetical protein
MKLFRHPAVLLSICLCVAASPDVRAEQSRSGPSSRVDPKALELLKQMGATLGSAKAFTYRSRSIIEVPARTGQYLTLFSSAEVALKRPDMLRAKLSGEAPHFDFYYNGDTISAFASGGKVFSVVKAPPTIDAMLPELHEQTGIRFISMPLLFSNPYEILTRGLISGMVVGSTTINGIPCEHLAFRSPGVNWEIWIESGKRALPWRLAATFTDRTNFPRTLVEFVSWNLNPWLSSNAFVFRKPAGAREIPFPSVMRSVRR